MGAAGPPAPEGSLSQVGRVLRECEWALSGGVRGRNVAIGRCRGPKTGFIQEHYYVMGPILSAGREGTSHCSHGELSHFYRTIN